MKAHKPPKIGVALGSGASRGWSHIGVLKALLEAEIRPSVVCGTSVGALIGASYAADRLDAIEQWVLGATRKDVLGFFSIKMTHGAFVNTTRLNWFLQRFVADDTTTIEDLDVTFAAVCTNLETGREIWLQEGGLAEAVRASMAMPGLFAPVLVNQRWLVDGGLVNPVPVTTCRALGAEIVIGVNLNRDILGKHVVVRKAEPAPETEPESEGESLGLLDGLKKQAREYSNSLFADDDDHEKPPGMFATVSQSINIFQDRITRSRLAGDPADVMVSPKLGDIGLLEFQRAGEAIEEGYAQTKAMMSEIRDLLQSADCTPRD